MLALALRRSPRLYERADMSRNHGCNCSETHCAHNQGYSGHVDSMILVWWGFATHQYASITDCRVSITETRCTSSNSLKSRDKMLHLMTSESGPLKRAACAYLGWWLFRRRAERWNAVRVEPGSWALELLTCRHSPQVPTSVSLRGLRRWARVNQASRVEIGNINMSPTVTIHLSISGSG